MYLEEDAPFITFTNVNERFRGTRLRENICIYFIYGELRARAMCLNICRFKYGLTGVTQESIRLILVIFCTDCSFEFRFNVINLSDSGVSAVRWLSTSIGVIVIIASCASSQLDLLKIQYL